ncbi:MAG TPA: fumarylacetoacetate hydrolase family protein [Actinomycetales bacterium]
MTQTREPDTDAPASSVRRAAERLVEAARTHAPCPPVRDLLPDGDVGVAYAVQSAVLAPRLREGARAIGRKVGLTNPAVQRQLGVDEPDFGVLLDDMLCPQGVAVDHGRLLQPRIEAEVAFVLGADLDQPGELTVDTVRAAVDHAVAALEIVDSRVAGWDIRLVDTVADNASAGLFVLGDERVPLADVEPADVTMTMTRDGEQVSAGSGRDCLGDPLAALAWLATTCRDNGVPLRAGEVVLSGSLGPVVAVGPGETFEATISGLGTVRATFSGTGRRGEQQEVDT